jgi:hypothetical protein
MLAIAAAGPATATAQSGELLAQVQQGLGLTPNIAKVMPARGTAESRL